LDTGLRPGSADSAAALRVLRGVAAVRRAAGDVDVRGALRALTGALARAAGEGPAARVVGWLVVGDDGILGRSHGPRVPGRPRGQPNRIPTLRIIIASTRPGRVGLPIGSWVRALALGTWEADLVDLAEVGLPLMDEPDHPRLRRYTQRHTQEWSARVDAADAFVLVMAEYNHSFTAPLKNALDYLHHEWRRKPVGFVSYGGVSAGTRAVVALQPVVAALGLRPASAAVNIPFVQQFLDDEELTPNDVMEHAISAMLDELAALEAALRPLRSAAAQPA
jgi:NAD(P)H-dependent FMN reductase